MPEQIFDVEAARNPRDTAIPIFRVESQLDQEESKKQGKAVYKNVEMVEIIVPGDKTLRAYTYVREAEKRRWPKQYEAFKKGIDAEPDGYPLNQWPMMNPALIASLKDMNVFTVEQFAEVQDQHLQSLPHAQSLQLKARAFLDAQKDASTVIKLQAELEKLVNANESKQETIDKLNARLDALESMMRSERDEASPKRGRPRKSD